MNRGETLAYLAGVVDGDGYFMVAKDFRTSRTVHPYYRTTLGVQQLWPGKALRLFALVFEGKVKLDPSQPEHSWRDASFMARSAPRRQADRCRICSSRRIKLSYLSTSAG